MLLESPVWLVQWAAHRIAMCSCGALFDVCSIDPIVQALQDELATVRKQLFRQEEALQAKNKQNEELRRTIADLRGTLSATEEQLRALQPLWAIPATELVVTETWKRSIWGGASGGLPWRQGGSEAAAQCHCQ